MVMVKEEMRKGSWTEQEDLHLVCFVRLFGERRWDFIAKASGLNRTGKSCRLRWVNYLHPGLKRGRMTPQEKRLVLELHSLWGNRWSRIARKLPGRTDNEIKNYWRAHMRKMTKERKRSSSSSRVDHSLDLTELPPQAAAEAHDLKSSSACSCLTAEEFEKKEEGVASYPMDQIWNEIATSEVIKEVSFEDSCPLMPSSPTWECCSEAVWKIDDEELRMLLQTHHLISDHNDGGRETCSLAQPDQYY
ncbi:myb-related protein MYBAS1 isoform X1 [Musa acuminata AAA Group]|uniref:myb-related protein MYBAS1 isoform X1 n=1 Tax=Musa acuminata AAA Group TaxID=214697 RepID=UPI0031D1B956